ncbi:GyrI-like domain-containing protein [Lacinutrix iliipiscaria]|uniref:GyrI-like domain-containing protein n=1 Tax=Lacinutrix iliipiscaria TaxID=1230532 RepID=A0ABW5WNV9_9FLAO
MQPRIELIPQKQLVGHVIEMSLVNNKTHELFSGFMPLSKQIENTVSTDIFEVMVYDHSYFKNFNPNHSFIKWAALEVSTTETHLENMQTLNLNEGLYAIFNYKGLANGFGSFMNTILTEWLPESNYELDHRPHFNVLGAKYKNNHPDSEEDVYIPIKEK